MAKLLGLSLLFALLYTVCQASPFSKHQMETRKNESYELTTSVTWYQPPLYFTGQYETMSTTCGLAVSSGNMTHGGCTELFTDAMGIEQHPKRDCVFKMWTDTTTCAGSQSTEIVVPKGSGSTCINTGVLDGGKFTTASGKWSC